MSESRISQMHFYKLAARVKYCLHILHVLPRAHILQAYSNKSDEKVLSFASNAGLENPLIRTINTRRIWSVCIAMRFAVCWPSNKMQLTVF